MNEIEKINLSGVHSIIASNIPSKLPLSDKLGNCPKDIAKFGFFGDSPSFNNYYPDAKESDFVADESDFIQPVYRMLSNTIVISSRGLIEFPTDVLKAAVNKMVGQAIFPNHDDQIGNELGVVVDTVWQDSYKVGDMVIPAGINARMKIDAKSNPKIARGITMNPPSIHSTSCTVIYKWKPSHKFEKEWEFYEKMGTYDEKGELIRKIATEILYFTELSLVTHGADPFAKKLDENGKIILPDFAKAQSVDVNQTGFSYAENWREVVTNQGYVSTSMNKFTDGIGFSNNQNKKENMDLQEFLSLMSSVFGKSTNAESFKADLEEYKGKVGLLVDPATLSLKDGENEIVGFEKIKEEFSKLKGENASLKEKEGFISMGESYLNSLREEAVKMYKLSLKEGEKEDEAIISLINGSDMNGAKAMLNQYKTQVEEKSPLTCQHCGSTDISRASFKKEDDDNDEESRKNPKERNFSDVREKFIRARDFGKN